MAAFVGGCVPLRGGDALASSSFLAGSSKIRPLRSIRSAQPIRFEARAEDATPESLEVMRKFSEQYAKRTGTYFCSDLSVTAVVIRGLAEHKDTLGSPLCPCRHYEDKEAEVKNGFWNCPCVPMRERKECHCMLFLTPDNDFVGDQQEISPEVLIEKLN
eukprot:tig00021589_g22733.t1